MVCALATRPGVAQEYPPSAASAISAGSLVADVANVSARCSEPPLCKPRFHTDSASRLGKVTLPSDCQEPAMAPKKRSRQDRWDPNNHKAA